MERGERVKVRDFKGMTLVRRVWEDSGRGVLLCTEEAFQSAAETGEEPICVGFPKDDLLVDEPAEVPKRGQVSVGSIRPRRERPRAKAG